MELAEITPLILTWNEEPNIERTLESVSWASIVLVLDSGSTDRTSQIVSKFKNAQWHHRSFDNHTDQWNYGLSLVTTTWVLTLDADYACPQALAEELKLINPLDQGHAWAFQFVYAIYGKTLRATLYPPRYALFSPKVRRYVQDGHTQTLQVEPQNRKLLVSKVIHDDRKPLSRWFSSQTKYAQLEVDKLFSRSTSQLIWKDRLRLWIVPAPILTFFYLLIFKGLFLDGWAGLFYTMQRVYAELVLGLLILEKRIAETKSS